MPAIRNLSAFSDQLPRGILSAVKIRVAENINMTVETMTNPERILKRTRNVKGNARATQKLVIVGSPLADRNAAKIGPDAA